MPGDQTFSQVSRGLAAVRAAVSLLRTMGGSTVYVRVPMQTVNPGDSGQLGLAGAVTEDVALTPVVVRNARANSKDAKNRSRTELLFSAATLTAAREIYDAGTAKEFFVSALGVIVSGQILHIESFSADEFGGVPYLYRVVVSE